MPVLKGPHYYLLLCPVSAPLTGSVWILLVGCTVLLVLIHSLWTVQLDLTGIVPSLYMPQICSAAAVIHSRVLLSFCSGSSIPVLHTETFQKQTFAILCGHLNILLLLNNFKAHIITFKETLCISLLIGSPTADCVYFVAHRTISVLPLY